MMPDKCLLHEEKLHQLADDVGEIKQTLARVDECLRGNGRVGLVTRLDRLEQAHKLIRWLAGTASAGVIALVVKAAWGML